MKIGICVFMMRKERMFNQGTMLNNVALSGRIKNKVIKIVCGYEICIVELSCLSILHLIGKNEMISKKNDIKIKKQFESLLKNRQRVIRVIGRKLRSIVLINCSINS